MFYGIPATKKKDFQHALATIQDIYKGQFYSNDMLICLWRNMSFRQDQKFMTSFNSSVTNEQEQSLIWRLHTLTWAAKNALRVEGDFVECGVFKGFCSEVILKYLDFQDIPRQAYLYDTFQGLSEKTSTEQERRTSDYKKFDLEAIYKGVCEKFSKYKNVNIVRGVVPDSFAQAVPEKIAFMHIDMNSVQAEMLALEHLFDRVTPGGIIVFDDFGWSCYANQMSAELAFMNERGWLFCRVDAVFQYVAGAECQHAAGKNRHFLSGFRVAADALAFAAHLECAEGGDLDHLSALQGLADFREDCFYQIGRFVSGQTDLFVDSLAQISAGNGLVVHVAPQLKINVAMTVPIHNKAVNRKR